MNTTIKAKPERPKGCTMTHLRYLDALRESGITNMFGSSTYLKEAFPRLTREQSIKVVGYWMKTFGKEDR